MKKLLDAKLSWPLIYQMFCTLYINRRKFLTDFESVKRALVRQGKTTGYQRAYFLFSERSPELRVFLVKHGAKLAASSVNMHIRAMSTKKEKDAVRIVFSHPHFVESIADILTVGIQQHQRDRRYNVSISNILGFPHLEITHGDKLIAQIDMSDGTEWAKFSAVVEKVVSSK